MKLCKYFIKEPFSILVNDTTLPSDNIYREAAKVSTLSTGNVSKYNFLMREDVLPEN